MSNGIYRLARAVLLAALGVPSVAYAQEPAASLIELQQWVRIGDRVTVTDTNGGQLTGRIARLKTDRIGLVGDGVPHDAVREFAQADLLSISRREPDSLGNGALIGLSVGGGLFLAAFLSSADGCLYESNCGALIAVGTAFYGGIGALIGVGIDALVPGREKVIYRHPAGHATLGVSPRLAPERQAVVFSVRF